MYNPKRLLLAGLSSALLLFCCCSAAICKKDIEVSAIIKERKRRFHLSYAERYQQFRSDVIPMINEQFSKQKKLDYKKLLLPAFGKLVCAKAYCHLHAIGWSTFRRNIALLRAGTGFKVNPIHNPAISFVMIPYFYNRL